MILLFPNPNPLLQGSFHQIYWREPKRSTSERKSQPEQVPQINGDEQIDPKASVAISFKSIPSVGPQIKSFH